MKTLAGTEAWRMMWYLISYSFNFHIFVPPAAALKQPWMSYIDIIHLWRFVIVGLRMDTFSVDISWQCMLDGAAANWECPWSGCEEVLCCSCYPWGSQDRPFNSTSISSELLQPKLLKVLCGHSLTRRWPMKIAKTWPSTTRLVNLIVCSWMKSTVPNQEVPN